MGDISEDNCYLPCKSEYITAEAELHKLPVSSNVHPKKIIEKTLFTLQVLSMFNK